MKRYAKPDELVFGVAAKWWAFLYTNSHVQLGLGGADTQRLRVEKAFADAFQDSVQAALLCIGDLHSPPLLIYYLFSTKNNRLEEWKIGSKYIREKAAQRPLSF